MRPCAAHRTPICENCGAPRTQRQARGASEQADDAHAHGSGRTSAKLSRSDETEQLGLAREGEGNESRVCPAHAPPESFFETTEERQINGVATSGEHPHAAEHMGACVADARPSQRTEREKHQSVCERKARPVASEGNCGSCADAAKSARRSRSSKRKAVKRQMKRIRKAQAIEEHHVGASGKDSEVRSPHAGITDADAARWAQGAGCETAEQWQRVDDISALRDGSLVACRLLELSTHDEPQLSCIRLARVQLQANGHVDLLPEPEAAVHTTHCTNALAPDGCSVGKVGATITDAPPEGLHLRPSDPTNSNVTPALSNAHGEKLSVVLQAKAVELVDVWIAPSDNETEGYKQGMM